MNTVSKFDFISLALALVLGTAGLPHVLMRLYTVPNAQEARRSVVWTIWLVGLFYLSTLVLGFGAMWLVGAKQIEAAPGQGGLRRAAAGLQAGRDAAAGTWRPSPSPPSWPWWPA